MAELPHPALAVAGPSGAGKSEFSRRIQDVYVLEMDEYFNDYRVKEYYLRPEWDTPGAYDLALLDEHGGRLLRGEKVRLAHFNFQTGCREQGPEVRLSAGQGLLVEGLYAFRVNLAYARRVYLDASFPLMVERCLPRDQTQRGRTDLKKILGMYETSWRKYAKVLFPQKDEADLVLGADWMDWLPEKLSLNHVLREKIERP